MITYDDFKKLELRVATVLTAEAVPEADKLLKLTVSLGIDLPDSEAGETRQIVAGVKASYPNPEDLVGKQIVLLANLEPKVLRGLESNGMLLAANSPDGPILLTPERPVPAGSMIK